MLKQSKSLVVIFITAIMLSFQQCSKVDFSVSDLDSQSKLESNIAKDDVKEDEDGYIGIDSQEENPGADNEQPADEDETEALRAKCKTHRLLPLRDIADGSVISNVRGHLFARFTGRISIENFRGNLVLFATSAQSIIASARNIRGNFIVCAGSVDVLQDVRGNTLILRGDVDNVDNHRGNLIVYDGQIGSVTNSVGHIRSVAGK